LARKVIACRRGEKDSRANEVSRVTAPAHRYPIVKRSGEGRIIEERLCQLRLERRLSAGDSIPRPDKRMGEAQASEPATNPSCFNPVTCLSIGTFV